MIQYFFALFFFCLAGIMVYYLKLALAKGQIISTGKTFVLDKELKFHVRRGRNPIWYWGYITIQVVLLIFFVVLGWKILYYDGSFIPAPRSASLTTGMIFGSLFSAGISILVFWTALDAWRHGILENFSIVSTITSKKESPLLFWFVFAMLILFGIYMLILALRILGMV